MKKIAIISLAMLIIVQCAPPSMMEKPSEKDKITISTPCTPSKLTVKPDDRKISLRWETNCAEAVLLSGYYIYILEKPLEQKYFNSPPSFSIRPYNPIPYPGDTDPESRYETMTIEDLDNGKEYFITVRSVYPDGGISGSSNEVAVICRPEGEFKLAFRYAGLNDGFSFSKGKAIRADASANDIYFFQKDGFDFIASPDRLNGFLRKSLFYSLGKTENIYQYPKFDLDIPSAEKLPILAGESYLVKTADGNFAKIRIEAMSGEGKERTLKINYIYQTVKGLIRFQ
jgi:hypothetical protein